MPSEHENLRLMWGILQQQIADGKLVAIDWQKIGADLGIEAGAASKRWSRLRVEIEKGGIPAPATPSTPKKAGAKKTAKSQENGDGDVVEKPKRAYKKRKTEKVEETDINELEED